MSADPRLLVWTQGEVWRWTYEEPSANGSGPFRLDSSIAFPDAQEARSAAEVAFPGVRIETTRGEAPERGGPDRGGPRPGGPGDGLVADVLLAAVVGLAVLVIPDRGRVARACVDAVRLWLAELRREAAPAPPAGRIRTTSGRVARR